MSNNQQYFEGVKKGIHFGVEWAKLTHSVKTLKDLVRQFEQDLVDPLAVRLGPQLDSLDRQMKIEYQELDDLMDDDNGVNRETEFESILYNLSVFKLKFKNICKQHKAREKKLLYKGKPKRSTSSV
jgi:hypothetical protein